MQVKSVAALAASVLGLVAVADTVTLKSGSVLVGETGDVRDGALQFKSEDLGKLSIKIENIKSVDVEKNHKIIYKDGRVEDKNLAVKDGKLLAAGVPLDLAAVKATDPIPETWHGSIDIGFQAARGNTYETSGSVLANVNRRWDDDRFTGDFGYYYSETGKADEETRKTTDRWDVEAKHDHFWFPKVYNYEDLKYERDVIQDLNARYRVGLGVGYQWLENSVFESTGKWSFNQELGVNWIKEEYENNDDAKKDGFCALRYAHHLNYIPKWTEGLEFFHNFEILPEVDEWEKFLAKGDAGFTTKLIYDFNLIAKIEWDYNSKPANNRKKDDLRYIVGLGYKW